MLLNLDILVILSAWLLLDSLYALTTTVSAVPPHFSTWTLHSEAACLSG